MEFVEEYDSVYIPDEQQNEDSDKSTDKAELLHSNSCLRTLYTDLQKAAEMAEDSNMLLRNENSELKNQIKSMRQSIQNVQPLLNELEDIQAAKTEKDQICDALEARHKELARENEILRQQVEALTNEASNFLLEKEQQEKEITNLSCVLRALQQQLEENRLHLEQKDESINQRDFIIEQLKDSVSEYITINQDMKEKLKELDDQLALALVSGEGSFMNVDTMLAVAPEHSVSLGEELGILSKDEDMKKKLKDLEDQLALALLSGEGSFTNVDTMLAVAPEHSVSLGEELGILSKDEINHEEEQKEEEENAEALEEQAAFYMSESSKRNIRKGVCAAVTLCFSIMGVFGALTPADILDTICHLIKPYFQIYHTSLPPV